MHSCGWWKALRTFLWNSLQFSVGIGHRWWWWCVSLSAFCSPQYTARLNNSYFICLDLCGGCTVTVWVLPQILTLPLCPWPFAALSELCAVAIGDADYHTSCLQGPWQTVESEGGQKIITVDPDQDKAVNEWITWIKKNHYGFNLRIIGYLNVPSPSHIHTCFLGKLLY